MLEIKISARIARIDETTQRGKRFEIVARPEIPGNGQIASESIVFFILKHILAAPIGSG